MNFAPPPTLPCLGYRHCVMFLGLCGLSICYMMRIAPGIAIISMVQAESSAHNPDSFKTFNWTAMEQNTILSSFFYSYLAMQIPAGWIAQYAGGKWPFATGISICGLLCLLIPKLVEIGGFVAFLLLRICQGVCQGLCYPSIHRISGRWFPPHEYSLLSGILHSGYLIGTVFAMAGSGYLIKVSGWPTPFYVSGALALTWLPFWLWFVSETPATHRTISNAERHYILDSLTAVENGLLSAAPYFAALIFMSFLTPVDRLIVRRTCISVPNLRKLWSGLGTIGKSILLVAIAYLDSSHKTTIIILLIVNVMLSSAVLLGFNLADLDLAPPYAGMLYSIFNCCSTLSAILAPLVVGAFSTSFPPPVAWQNVFLVSSALSFTCGFLYLLFGRQVPLSWLTSTLRVSPRGEPNTDDAEHQPLLH